SSSAPIPPNGRIKHTFVKTSENIDSVLIYAGPMGATRGNGIIIRNVKIEKGNKATDWTPAPEDIDERFTDIEGTLASHSTKIEQNAQQIQLRATKAEVDTLTGRVNQAESQITQLAGQIELRATKTEVDALTGRVNTVESTVQQTAENVSISFQRLNNIEGILDSAVTTIDRTGITVKDGSFFLEDDNVDTKYSIVPKTNLVV